jgi:hypothetical protein
MVSRKAMQILLLAGSIPSFGAMRRGEVLRAATAAAATAGVVPWSARPASAGTTTRLLQEAQRATPEVLLAKVPTASAGPTNEIVGVVDGIRQKRLGGSDIIVSEVGLGTQRWGSTDFNAPDTLECFNLMNRAILESGVNLIDTAEQYPIPSNFPMRPEGFTEQLIGQWLKQDASRRRKVVLASKITGGDNVNKANIIADCEGSLKRLGTDYLDVYMLHWPARYTPQSNWGQSLEFNPAVQELLGPQASFAEIAEAMGGLIKAGKIRGWGMCNDTAYGLAASVYVGDRSTRHDLA